MVSRRALDLAAQLWGWRPHSDGQRDWMLSSAKLRVAACGRRWGKTEGTGVAVALRMLERPNEQQIVTAPTDDQTRIIMDEVSRRLHAVPGLTEQIVEKRAPYHVIKLRDGEGAKRPTSVMGRTAGSDGKGIRGHAAHHVVVDEAAFVPDGVFEAVLTPLLADFDGDLTLISTPYGRNFFWEAFEAARGGSGFSAQYPSWANPHISRDYIEQERRARPERVFRAEYGAVFVDVEGLVFRSVLEAVDAGRAPDAAGHCDHAGEGPWTMGVDLARVADYTVVTVLDASGRQVYWRREGRLSWERQIAWIADAAARYRAKVLVDSTGVGDPIYEILSKSGVEVEPYHFTHGSKAALVDNLAIRLERGELRLADVEAQTAELLAYEATVSASGNVKTNAPSGRHDDCVIALALAAWRPKQGWAKGASLARLRSLMGVPSGSEDPLPAAP